MREPPIHLLEALSSIEEQRRYIVHATKEEYLLPDDLLNDAYQFCDWARREVGSEVAGPQKEAVATLHAALEVVNLDGFDRTNIADLIEYDARWAAARERALMTLTAFGRRPLA